MLPQGLAETLIDSGLLLPDQAESARMMAQQENIPFVTLLIRQGITDSDRLAATIANCLGYPLLDLAAIDIKACLDDTMDPELMQRHRLIPLRAPTGKLSGSPVFIVFADPASLTVIDELRLHGSREINAVVADGVVLWKMLADLQAPVPATTSESTKPDKSQRLNPGTIDNLNNATNKQVADPPVRGEAKTDDAPLVRFVDQVLREAIATDASDIHIEPFEKTVRIRCRIDGTLREVTRADVSMAPRIISRIKVMADMDISERRLPQDGRLRLSREKQNQRSGTEVIAESTDFRVNSMPTLWGEKVVLRLLDKAATQKSLEELGYTPQQTSHYRQALRKSHGLILITGPTGSGKTVSLYAGLDLLNTLERNISTVEDPIEMQIDGINQVAVNKRTGLDFASALKAFMRQDPDILMVGEIRDQETADIAVKAAQTGHLVLATLHTNNAAGSITRLLNMGIPPYNLSGSLSLIVAQRLVRQLCGACKVPDTDATSQLRAAGMTAAQAASANTCLPVGCERCHQGYRGRICVAETLPMSGKLDALMLNGATSTGIEDAARKMGHLSLRESALIRVANGDITLADAERLEL
ncbi:GspE/PulE family protein [Pseudohongiella acticola]|nr:ATPase, T2SS/T4P/T4SS family [Pseudohongiella acticola]